MAVVKVSLDRGYSGVHCVASAPEMITATNHIGWKMLSEIYYEDIEAEIMKQDICKDMLKKFNGKPKI